MKWIEINSIKPADIPCTKEGYFISKDIYGFVRCSTAHDFREFWLLLGDEIKYILDENDDSEAELAFNAASERTLYDPDDPDSFLIPKYPTYQSYKDSLK